MTSCCVCVASSSISVAKTACVRNIFGARLAKCVHRSDTCSHSIWLFRRRRRQIQTCSINCNGLCSSAHNTRCCWALFRARPPPSKHTNWLIAQFNQWTIYARRKCNADRRLTATVVLQHVGLPNNCIAACRFPANIFFFAELLFRFVCFGWHEFSM